MSEPTSKVVVIGLDGATFDLLTPMMARGLLPNLARLVRQGASGPLRSVIPPVSGPAWVSFMTGKHPGRHGVFDFHRFLPGRTGKAVISFRDVRATSLWEALSERGKTVGVINVPITYPPYPVKGFMITGMLTPSDAGERRMHPPALHDELTRRFGTYIPDVWWAQYEAGREPDLLRDLIRCMDQKQEIATTLMQEKPCDFFMTTITETDRLQHAFGAELFDAERLRRRPRGSEIAALIDRFYARMDEHVGRLCALAGPDATVFVVSDHGFGPTRRFFLANRWLERVGLLRIRRSRYYRSAWTRHVRRHPSVRALARRLNPFGLSRLVRAARAAGADEMTETQAALTEEIDWSRTRAYMDLDDQQGLWINLRGREAHGIVDPADYERVREEVIGRLQALVDDEGKKVATFVARREAVYEGEYAADAPDVIVRFDEFETYGVGLLDLGLFKTRLFEQPQWPFFSAHHRIDGILIAAGPAVKVHHAASASLVDLFPTILYAMNMSVPDDLDGRVIESIFTDEYRRGHPIQRHAAGIAAPRGPEEPEGAQDNAKLIESLRGLGYF